MVLSLSSYTVIKSNFYLIVKNLFFLYEWKVYIFIHMNNHATIISSYVLYEWMHWIIFQNDSSIYLKYLSSLQLALIKIIFVVMFDSSHNRCNFKINYSYISSKKAKLAAKIGKTMWIAFLHSLHALYTLLLPFSGRHLVLFWLSIPIDYFYSTIISCISIE